MFKLTCLVFPFHGWKNSQVPVSFHLLFLPLFLFSEKELLVLMRSCPFYWDLVYHWGEVRSLRWGQIPEVRSDQWGEVRSVRAWRVNTGWRTWRYLEMQAGVELFSFYPPLPPSPLPYLLLVFILYRFLQKTLYSSFKKLLACGQRDVTT